MSSMLRLASEEDGVDTLPFERRTSQRNTVSGRVTAVESCAPQDGPSRICSLQLQNISDFGLGALVQEPIEPGTAITVLFPPHGAERGFDLYGNVVRCERRGDLFELGISLRTRAAA